MSCKKTKTGRESPSASLSALLAWYQTAQTSDTHIDGNILCARTRKIAYRMQTDNFAAPNGGI